MQELLQSGLILPADEKYKRISERQEELPELLKDKIDFHFLHDRVYQAAYKLIPEETNAAYPSAHWPPITKGDKRLC